MSQSQATVMCVCKGGLVQSLRVWESLSWAWWVLTFPGGTRSSLLPQGGLG